MANAPKNRSGIILLVLLGLLVATGIFFAIRSLSREQVAVRVVPVTYQTLIDTVATNGKVEPVEEYQAHAPGPGVIDNVYVDIGEHVKPGQLLVRMADADAKARVASSKASLSSSLLTLHALQQGGSLEDRTRFSTDIASAQAEQRSAASNFAQIERLQQRGSVSAAEVANARQRLDSANLNLSTISGHSTIRYDPEDISNARSRVADASAGVAAAQAGYNAVDIRSPIAGTVYAIPFSQYDFVESGRDPLLAVADLNHVRVRAYFDEPDIGRLQRGQAVKITWEAKPNAVWHGHIEVAPTTVTTYHDTRSVGECIITVDDAKGDLLPNTNVLVTVTRAQRFNVLSIPREALHTDGLKDYVYRIVNGKLARTSITTGVVNNNSLEITSGLKDNDVVVLAPVTPGRDLTDGLEVKKAQ